MTNASNITADAVALQERDGFRPDGWVKAIAPAKVNLHLAIGGRRPDGYHDAISIMHALTLHDTLYLRCSSEGKLTCRMISGDPSIELPNIPIEGNLAARAVMKLAATLDLAADATHLELRIEKNIPTQAGLGGGSSDAAAALVAAAHLWGIPADDPRIEATARELGADTAFFLHGGCAYLEGTGNEFAHALIPSHRSIVLVKPEGGVSTAAAYHAFDANPIPVPDAETQAARAAQTADELVLFNNLASAAEMLMPELAEIREWLIGQPQASTVLLCGSGATTFAACDDFATATRIAAAASARGWWSRATSFSGVCAAVVGGRA